MLFGKFHQELTRLGEYGSDLFLLMARLVIATGFAEAARMKWDAIEAVGKWFTELGYPLPVFNAYFVSSIEMVGVVLLALGLLTRLVVIPLMIIMVVAILTVHLPYGFSCAEQGFEVPLYYFIFLGIFFSHGPGRYSLDRFIFKGC